MTKIPIRKVNTYQSDNGNKIEELITEFEIEGEIEEEMQEIANKKVIYFGCVVVATPIGTEEIKFPIEADSLKEAFENIDSELNKLKNELENQIIEPTGGDLIV